jgi:hypothetical protein
MIDRLIEIGRCCGMEMNGGKTNIMRISRELSQSQIAIDQEQVENVEYFGYLGSMITNQARWTHEIKSRIAMAKAAFCKNTVLGSKLDLNLRMELVNCYIWKVVLYGAVTWTLQTVDQIYLRS